MDYMDLNEACPKDSFPLPRIDQIVDASTGHGMLSFLDAFSSYHHIPMHFQLHRYSSPSPYFFFANLIIREAADPLPPKHLFCRFALRC